jgi:hypothetical protein
LWRATGAQLARNCIAEDIGIALTGDKFILLGVDCEPILQAELNKQQAKSGWKPSPQDREDAEQALRIALWRASVKFDPARYPGGFGSLVRTVCVRALIDHWRLSSVLGRNRWQWSGGKTYEKPARQNTLSLDAQRDGEFSLGETVPDRSSDSEADRVARDDAWLFAQADLHSARDHELIQAEFAADPAERIRRDRAGRAA